MVRWLEPVFQCQAFLKELKFRVHSLNKTTAGSAYQVVVVGSFSGRLITGHPVRGDELGGFAAAAEAFKRTVNGGYADTRKSLLRLAVDLLGAQMSGTGGEHIQNGIALVAVPRAIAIASPCPRFFL